MLTADDTYPRDAFYLGVDREGLPVIHTVKVLEYSIKEGCTAPTITWIDPDGRHALSSPSHLHSTFEGAKIDLLVGLLQDVDEANQQIQRLEETKRLLQKAIGRAMTIER